MKSRPIQLLQIVYLKVVRYSSILRIIYSNKNVKNKFEKDIVEKNKIKKINKFREYVYGRGIFLSKNGAIFSKIVIGF